jgi:hypothetical protein
MKIWHKENPQLLEAVKNSIEENFSTLHFVMENDVVFIRGALHLPENLGFYSIEIELLNDYPDSVPLVRETGGKIKRDGDHHIWTTGNCCLFVEEETFRYYPKGTTIKDFVQKVVTGHFINQKYFELTDKWLEGDRSHGLEGKLEFYQHELKTDNIVFIYRFIEHLAKVNIKKYWACFCGSKKLMQNCHLKLLLDYRKKITPQIAKNTLLMFDHAIEELRKIEIAKRKNLENNTLKRVILGLRD